MASSLFIQLARHTPASEPLCIYCFRCLDGSSPEMSPGLCPLTLQLLNQTSPSLPTIPSHPLPVWPAPLFSFIFLHGTCLSPSNSIDIYSFIYISSLFLLEYMHHRRRGFCLLFTVGSLMSRTVLTHSNYSCCIGCVNFILSVVIFYLECLL